MNDRDLGRIYLNCVLRDNEAKMFCFEHLKLAFLVLEIQFVVVQNPKDFMNNSVMFCKHLSVSHDVVYINDNLATNY